MELSEMKFLRSVRYEIRQELDVQSVALQAEIYKESWKEYQNRPLNDHAVARKSVNIK